MTGCVEFSGYVTPDGYGQLPRPVQGERLAHRVAFATVFGPIPAGLTIDHLCGNRACIIVSHMELVTRGENARRGSLKTHCVRGHDLSVTRKLRADGRPRCGACPREYHRSKVA